MPNAATNVSCFLDETCYAGNSWVGTFSNGVAYLVFDDHTCSGTLLNDRNSTNTPYLMTAGHCIADQTEACSMVAVFDFRSAVCNGMAGPPSSFPQVIGSTLLAQNVHLTATGDIIRDQPDFAFLRLTSYPNAAWRSMGLNFAPGISDRLTSISHPRNLPQRLGSGSILDQSNPNFFTIHMSQGVVNHGSSGSGLVNDDDQQVGVFSYLPNKSDVSSCDIPNRDYGYTKAGAIYPAIKLWIEAPGPLTGPIISSVTSLTLNAKVGDTSTPSQSIGLKSAASPLET